MTSIVVGVDEVGRGPWAGPIVSCAVAFYEDQKIDGLTDSKKLSKNQRALLSSRIKQHAASIGIGWVTAGEIDHHGLTQATTLSMSRALDQIQSEYYEIIIDGSINYLHGSNIRAEIKADQNYQCVSAASVIAKVARDHYMVQMAKLYPTYGFEKHVGYGTQQHTDSLAIYGITPIHRLSYAPVAALI